MAIPPPGSVNRIFFPVPIEIDSSTPRTNGSLVHRWSFSSGPNSKDFSGQMHKNAMEFKQEVQRKIRNTESRTFKAENTTAVEARWISNRCRATSCMRHGASFIITSSVLPKHKPIDPCWPPDRLEASIRCRCAVGIGLGTPWIDLALDFAIRPSEHIILENALVGRCSKKALAVKKLINEEVSLFKHSSRNSLESLSKRSLVEFHENLEKGMKWMSKRENKRLKSLKWTHWILR